MQSASQVEQKRGGKGMNEIVRLISTVGFPIVACLLLGWYVKYQTDSYRSEVQDIQKEHREEVQKMTEAINNNTVALTQLCEKIKEGVKE